MTADELRALADNATYLHERLAGEWIPNDTPANRQAAQTRLERWRQLAAGGDATAFARRLAWLGLSLSKPGLDEPAALRLLGDGHRTQPGPLPAWADFLAAVLAAGGSERTPTPAAFVQPFVAEAQSRLERAVGECWQWLSPSAQNSLTTHLTDQLTALAQPTLAHASLWLDRSAICHNYPVLARQLCSAALHWQANASEFLARLAADWPALTKRICAYPYSSVFIASLHPGLSDPHRGGRTVWQVDLAGGVSVAYKPKELALDRAWNDLLVWCNVRGLSPALRALWTLPRAGYGWMEWAEGDGSTEDPDFYPRAGALLALLHLLHASDAHRENLVVLEGHPHLIDAEMLRYPQMAGQTADDPLDVLRTGLLPRWAVQGAEMAEMGALSGAGAAAHWQAIATGYESACRFLAQQWEALSAAEGPLAAFRRGAVRFAPRPTAAYTRLLEHLRHPAFLARGSDFSVEADRLAYSYSRAEERARLGHLLPLEHAAISRGDVPLFSAAVDGQSGWGEGATFPLPLHWPALAPPTPPAVAQQTRLIRASLERAAYLPAGAPGGESFLAWAVELGEALAERAIPLGDGRVGWLGVHYQPVSGLHQHGLIGDDLYAGQAGIALFLAALHRVTGEERWQALAQASQPPSESDSRNRHAWGVLDGETGRLLGLLTLHRQTASDSALAQAAASGERLLAAVEEWTHPRRALGGFSHGAAGIAFGLTKLYEATGEARFLQGAAQGWAFQRTLYDGAAGNWQDRRGEVPVYLDNWCNGAAGIGLAGAGCLASLPELADVVERAAGLLMAAQPPFLDTLCCGWFGQIDCLLEMGLLLERPAWVAAATEQARVALGRAAGAGAFCLYDDLPAHLFNPAFFRGVAGIGYTLLRLAGANGETKEQLPCVLNWST